MFKIKLGKVRKKNWDSNIIFYTLDEKKRNSVGAGNSFKFDPWL